MYSHGLFNLSGHIIAESEVCLHVFPAVCAEAFNPDEEEEDTEPRVVHPKTDEQRCRLQESCRDILLFKTLDQVQLSHTGRDTYTQGLVTSLLLQSPYKKHCIRSVSPLISSGFPL